MARLIFPATQQGIASAEAVAQPRHVLIRPGRDVLVFTEADMPESLDPKAVTLTKQQFLYGLLQVGGQILLNAVLAYQSDRITNGTPAQQIHWNYSNEFRRMDGYTAQARVAVQGAKTNAVSKAEWDQVFIVGSGYEPPMSTGG